MEIILNIAQKCANIWLALAAIGTWIAAAATIIAVSFAIKLQRKYAKSERPLLSVKIKPDVDKCFEYIDLEIVSSNDHLTHPNRKREELWVRALVSNLGNTAARDVQIRLIEILREESIDPQSRPNLWFKVSNLNQTSLNILPRGIEQPFDIAFICHSIDKSTKGHQDEVVSFHLMMVKPEIDKTPWIDIKDKVERNPANKLILGYKYTLHIAVLSSNADAVHCYITLRMVNPASDPDIQSRLGFQTLEKNKLRTYLRVEQPKFSTHN